MTEPDFTPPPSDAQLRFARSIAARLRDPLPRRAQTDRRAMSRWISDREDKFRERVTAVRGPGATPRQVAFAERLARARRRAVPDECFRDAGLMSRWIDSNR